VRNCGGRFRIVARTGYTSRSLGRGVVKMGRVSGLALAIVAAAPLVVFCAAPARSADAFAGASGGAFTPVEEIRGGVFYDDPSPRESPSIVASFEALSSQLKFYGGGNPYLAAFLNPRLNAGAMVSVEGRTSYGFAGVNWRVPIWDRFFAEAEFGGALNDSARRIEPGRTDLGCPLTFRESGGLGYQITSNIDVVASVEHVSHASLCGKENPGLTNFGLRIGYRF